MPRLSLSKSDATTDAGAELLAVCQESTLDGTLSKDEIARLIRWRQRHGDSDLPAARFMTTLIDRIIVDGRISKEEQSELQLAMESVLPLDLRRGAKAARAGVEGAKRAEAKASAEAEREQKRNAKAAERSDRELRAPVEQFDFKLVGVREGSRQKAIARFGQVGAKVQLVRDPSNRHGGGKAVMVLGADGSEMGFVPQEEAEELAPMLDQGLHYMAEIGEMYGYTAAVPIVRVALYKPEAGVTGARPAGARTARSGSGVGAMMVIIGLVIFAVIALSVRACI